MEAQPREPVVPTQSSPGSQTEWPQLAGCSSLLLGLLLIVMGSAHLYGVLVTAAERSYRYDFRLAALLLVGIEFVFAAALCLSAIRGLVRGQRSAWARALIGTILLLIVLIPLSPVQPDMGPGLSFLAAVNLLVLLVARRQLKWA